MKTITDSQDARSNEAGFDRRAFLKSSAFVGGCAAMASAVPFALSQVDLGSQGGLEGKFPPYLLADPENVLYSTCLQCHVDCQIKAKIWDGTLAKISGNPYSPQNYLPHLAYETELGRAARTDGKLCSKGQSAIQTCYDAYRLRKVLKRTGPRGSNQWRTIEFDEFISEVVEGGQLFKDIGDDRRYPGFDEVYAVRDPATAKALAADAALFASGEMTLEAFKTKHADNLDLLIDPDHPDLGPKNNGFVFDAGRIEHGRKELMKRFVFDSFGSINAFEHTTICEQSHHIAYNEMTVGATHHLKPDLSNCEFVLFWGTGAFTANFGSTPMAEKVTLGLVERGMKTAVVDPRLSNDAAKADYWLPVKPGGDLALGLAMQRWIFENERYDTQYLANANKAAAARSGEPTWTNATHLVKIVDGRPTEFLRSREAGLGDDDRPVVMSGGKTVAVDDENAVVGDLRFAGRVGAFEVKSSFELLVEEATSHTWEEYEEESGIERDLVARVAHELTNHGKRAAVELYRGPVQHTDGFYTGCALITLNLLIGNPDWKGGLAKGGGHWHEFGGKKGNFYNFKEMHPDKLKAFGPRITREKARYEDCSLFRENGYPSRRPWYPFSSNIYQEIIPSMAAGYPYPCKILFLHKGTPVLATPAGQTMIEMLRDPERIPLFIACDIVIGETSMFADYILPDLSFLERWGTPHVTPDVTTMTSKVRQPVIAPMTEEVMFDGAPTPIALETFLLALAKRLGLSGFGKDGFGAGENFDRSEDFFLRAIANIAVGDKSGEEVPDADAREMEVFRQARRHLPPSVFDEARWQAAVGDRLWPKVVYVLNRGGRFASFDTAYDGEFMKKRYGKMFHLFVERVARQKNSMSGELFDGHPIQRGQRDAVGRPLDTGDARYPFALITYKEAFGGHSRTISNYWTNVAMRPENAILMHRRDAKQLDLNDGQRVRLVSASNPEGVVDLGNGNQALLEGRVETCEGLRPGVVAVSWHYGHWAYGARDVEVDGEIIKGDARRGAGLCPNPVMTIDPVLGDVCLTDPIGASSSFFDTKVGLKVV